MPSLAMYPLNPLADSKEYEKIIRDYCEKKFGGNVFLFGRSGQRQYGVDIVSEYSSKIIGVQCKDYGDTVIKEKDIDDMISLAETFEPTLDLFIIAIAKKQMLICSDTLWGKVKKEYHRANFLWKLFIGKKLKII